jgi:Pyruvate/2-oxoacid:ferredoxin oxidoreductase gamma subunit
MSAEVERRIAAMVAKVEKDQKRIRVFSTGEQIAVALVLDRSELFPHGGYTMLKTVERLGSDWTRAALKVQRRRT